MATKLSRLFSIHVAFLKPTYHITVNCLDFVALCFLPYFYCNKSRIKGILMSWENAFSVSAGSRFKPYLVHLLACMSLDRLALENSVSFKGCDEVKMMCRESLALWLTHRRHQDILLVVLLKKISGSYCVLIECLLCARHCPKLFTNVISFNPSNNLMRLIPLSISFDKWRQ